MVIVIGILAAVAIVLAIGWAFAFLGGFAIMAVVDLARWLRTQWRIAKMNRHFNQE